jgi:hypothetical protein
VSQTLSDSADLNERLARALARALVAELRAEIACEERSRAESNQPKDTKTAA